MGWSRSRVFDESKANQWHFLSSIPDPTYDAVILSIDGVIRSIDGVHTSGSTHQALDSLMSDVKPYHMVMRFASDCILNT